MARGGVREGVRLAVMVGFLGGFTTFSAFGVEAVGLMREGRVGWAVMYVAGSVGVGLVAVAVGWWGVGR
jgi:CrcB protein